MNEHLMQVHLTEMKYVPLSVEDPQCGPWNGLLEFAVENGGYVAAVPFVNLAVPPPNGVVTPNILVYDGVGGYCGEGTSAQITFRVSAACVQNGSNFLLEALGGKTATHLGSAPLTTVPPSHTPVQYSFSIPIKVAPPNPGRVNAKLWVQFTVGTMC